MFWVGRWSQCHLFSSCFSVLWLSISLTHWGRVTHICVGKLTIIGSDNGLSPGWRQAIVWTNNGILLIGALGTNFSEILIEIQTFSFWKNNLKVSSGKWRPFCLSLNDLTLEMRVLYTYIQVERGNTYLSQILRSSYPIAKKMAWGTIIIQKLLWMSILHGYVFTLVLGTKHLETPEVYVRELFYEFQNV